MFYLEKILEKYFLNLLNPVLTSNLMSMENFTIQLQLKNELNCIIYNIQNKLLEQLS